MSGVIQYGTLLASISSELAVRFGWGRFGRVKGDAVTIKITQHVDLPAIYICPTCLKLTPFQIGEHWQVCEEHHFAEVRTVTFANGEARNGAVPVEKTSPKWAEQDNSFG